MLPVYYLKGTFVNEIPLMEVLVLPNESPGF